ncbi:hypothetical protein CH063_11730, partial [Colletotrichum higginsianum]
MHRTLPTARGFTYTTKPSRYSVCGWFQESNVEAESRDLNGNKQPSLTTDRPTVASSPVGSQPLSALRPGGDRAPRDDKVSYDGYQVYRVSTANAPRDLSRLSSFPAIEQKGFVEVA